MTFAGLATFSSIFLVASMLLTWVVLNYLRSKAILDMPNHRSSHAVPTPRGGGLAVTPLLIILVAVVFAFTGVTAISNWLMLAAAAGLACSAGLMTSMICLLLCVLPCNSLL